jgi:transposase-like protein
VRTLNANGADHTTKRDRQSARRSVSLAVIVASVWQRRATLAVSASASVNPGDFHVAGAWRYVYRAMDNDGPVVDACVSPRRIPAALTFFAAALLEHGEPDEVVTTVPPRW